MSKAPKNIEKIILAVAVLIGGALAAFGYMKLGKADEDFSGSPSTPRGGDVSVVNADKVPATVNSVTSDRVIEPAKVESDIFADGREVDLFVGVPLFADRKNPNSPIDLLNTPPVHDGIENKWWIENGVSPNYADSPQRDADDDGFTNREEYNAQTDPSEIASHPELALKVRYKGDESVTWLLEFGLDPQGRMPKIEVIDGEGKGQKGKANFDKPVEEGDIFFSEEPFKDRFKFLGVEEREEINERLGNTPQKMKYGIYEDQKPNKNKKKYEIPSRISRGVRPDFYQYDRKAILELDAIGESGKTAKIEEGTKFSLPLGGEDKKYLLKSVTPEQVEIEWEANGKTESRVIPKG